MQNPPEYDNTFLPLFMLADATANHDTQPEFDTDAFLVTDAEVSSTVTNVPAPTSEPEVDEVRVGQPRLWSQTQGQIEFSSAKKQKIESTIEDAVAASSNFLTMQMYAVFILSTLFPSEITNVYPLTINPFFNIKKIADGKEEWEQNFKIADPSPKFVYLKILLNVIYLFGYADYQREVNKYSIDINLIRHIVAYPLIEGKVDGSIFSLALLTRFIELHLDRKVSKELKLGINNRYLYFSPSEYLQRMDMSLRGPLVEMIKSNALFVPIITALETYNEIETTVFNINFATINDWQIFKCNPPQFSPAVIGQKQYGHPDAYEKAIQEYITSIICLLYILKDFKCSGDNGEAFSVARGYLYTVAVNQTKRTHATLLAEERGEDKFRKNLYRAMNRRNLTIFCPKSIGHKPGCKSEGHYEDILHIEISQQMRNLKTNHSFTLFSELQATGWKAMAEDAHQVYKREAEALAKIAAKRQSKHQKSASTDFRP